MKSEGEGEGRVRATPNPVEGFVDLADRAPAVSAAVEHGGSEGGQQALLRREGQAGPGVIDSGVWGDRQRK